MRRSAQIIVFGSYLEGIETASAAWIASSRCLFGSYLEGIETYFDDDLALSLLEFGSYLEGIETPSNTSAAATIRARLDRTLKGLKLRNVRLIKDQLNRLDRTLKGLKRWTKTENQLLSKVWIVP
mgnify:CR=1 FL=1